METMKAVCIRSFGGPEVLQIEDIPRPQPGEDELLIHVAAASVNPIDYKIRSGAFGRPQQLPMQLGRDVSGVVVRCGAQVHHFQEGDEVFAMLPRDRAGYAEYVTVTEGDCAPKPKRADHEHAAAVPLAALTAWQGLFDHGDLKAGQRVLIHGASGGVGHFAVQFARHARAGKIIVTASAEDADFLRELGADRVIDYRTERFENEVREVDLVFDLIGGDTQERSWSVLKRGGTLVSTLGASEETARQYGVRASSYVTQPNARQLTQIAGLIDADEVHPYVQSTYPLEQAAEAQRHVERDHTRGKTVITVASAT